MDTIFKSKIFDRIRYERFSKLREGDEADIVFDEVAFQQWIAARVVAVAGDVTLPGLGIAPDVMARMARDVVVTIHCAASIDFDERLDLAVRLNIFGTLECLAVSSRLPRLERFVHVSTAFVQQSNDVIPEATPVLAFDYQLIIKEALGANGSEPRLKSLTAQVLRETGYPNTYTLTKAIAEVLLAGSPLLDQAKVFVVRPSIVGAAYREPVPGWVDVVSAASAVFLTGALGIVTLLPGNPRGVGAIIPVDFVANHMLLVALSPSPPRISHCCTSTENPVRWRVVHQSVQTAFRATEPKARLQIGSRRGFKMVQDPAALALEWAFCYDLPDVLLQALAIATGSPQHRELSQLMSLLNRRAAHIAGLFGPFTLVEYRFSTQAGVSQWLQRGGAPAGFETFSVAVRDIAWPEYFRNYAYGLMRFVLHEDLTPVSDVAATHHELALTTDRLVSWDPDHHTVSFPGIIGDVSWAYTSNRRPGYTHTGVFGRLLGLTGWREGLAHEARFVERRTVRSAYETRRLVLASAPVLAAIRADAKTLARTKQARLKCERLLAGVQSTLEDEPPRAFAWALRKVWRQMFDQVLVHEAGMLQVAELARANAKAPRARPIVLMPSHRSYVDFLLLSYVLFAYSVPAPFIAAAEDFAQLGPVTDLLRSSGAFFLKRDGTGDALYQAVFEEYLARLLEDGQTVEFFVEGTRSRSGKALEPRLGMIRMLLRALPRCEDIMLVPVSVDYERPPEVALYADELLGSTKPKESLANMLRAAPRALTQNFGRVSVQFAEPLSLRALAHAGESAVGVRVLSRLEQGSVCFTTHLLATLLLMYRHGATTQQLERAAVWLRFQVESRGGRVAGVEGTRPADAVAKALALLGALVTRRSTPPVFMVDLRPDNWANFLALAHYRNHLIHLFYAEALIACSLFARLGALSQDARDVVVDALGMLRVEPLAPSLATAAASATHQRPTVGRVAEDVAFLHSLLSKEFVTCAVPDVPATLALMETRGVVRVGAAAVDVVGARPFALLLSMVWPFVDGYFVACVGLLALLPSGRIPDDELRSRMMALAESLYHDGVIAHYESCSASVLANALAVFEQWKMIRTDKEPLPALPMQKQTAFRKVVSLVAPFDSRAALMGVVNKIDAMRKKGARELGLLGGAALAVARYPVLARL